VLFIYASDFSNIFDVDWFMSFLSKDVKIIEKLPQKGGQTWSPRRMRVPRKCNEKCYINRVLPVLQKRHVSFPVFVSQSLRFLASKGFIISSFSMMLIYDLVL